LAAPTYWERSKAEAALRAEAARAGTTVNKLVAAERAAEKAAARAAASDETAAARGWLWPRRWPRWRRREPRLRPRRRRREPRLRPRRRRRGLRPRRRRRARAAAAAEKKAAAEKAAAEKAAARAAAADEKEAARAAARAAAGAAGCSTCGSTTTPQWYSSAQGAKVCQSCWKKAHYAKQRAARSADEAALHRETDRKRARLARELGPSASLEDVVLGEK